MEIKKLNFGSGTDVKEGYVNADLSNADVNFDFDKFPYPFEDNYFDEIYAKETIDHLSDYFAVMMELYRISKPNAIIHIITPFYHTAKAHKPTHHYHFSYAYFIGLSKDKVEREVIAERIETHKDINCEIVEFKTIPHKFFKWIPDIKLGKHIGLRYVLGMIFGEIVQELDVKLIVIKECVKKKLMRDLNV